MNYHISKSCSIPRNLGSNLSGNFLFNALALVLVDLHCCAIQFNFHFKEQGNLIMELWNDVVWFCCQFKFHLILVFALKMLKMYFKVLRKC